MATVPEITAAMLPNHYEGDLSDFSEGYLTTKITNAVDKARSLYGAMIDARLASGQLTAATYEAVICEAVLRVVRNPEGFRSEHEGNYQYEQYATVAAGWLFFTDENVLDLTGVHPPKKNFKIGTASVAKHRGGF